MADHAVYPADYWHTLECGRVQCDVCPRGCKLKPDQDGLCAVRGRVGTAAGMALHTFGRLVGLGVDPIEKKPLYHFLPGTPVLSFGTVGCNLACRFCQNWDISRAKELGNRAISAAPDAIAQKAAQLGCNSVAYTYNDPVVFIEYAIATARACQALGIQNVAVTAGYVQPAPRRDLFAVMQAANVDLKGFSDRFYHRLCNGHLQPVLDTLVYLRHATPVWLEITTLLISGENDSNAELNALTKWIMENLGPDVPLHFSAFHPDYRMYHVRSTPVQTLTRARTIAMDNGLRYVYTGNVHDRAGGSTWCYNCGALLIERDWYRLGVWGLDGAGCCKCCGYKLPGVFNSLPGSWGQRRLPVTL